MRNKQITIRAWLRRRGWYVLLCAVALLGLNIPAMAFAKSLNGTFLGKETGREVAFDHHGKPLSDWAGTLKLKLDSGEALLVYCIQIDVRVRSGDRYRSDGAVLALPNGCKIRYLLDAYPASTAKDADEAAARQMAIWVFSDGVDPATIADAKVRARTIALVTEAAGKPCPKRRTEAPDLTIDPPTASAAVGQVVAYTVHASPADAGQALAMTLSGPAVFADASAVSTGQQQQTIELDAQSAATVWVLITGAGPTNIAVALPFRLEAGTVYSQIDDQSPTQRLVMAESLDLVANAAAQLAGAAGAPLPTTLATPLPTTPLPSQTAAPMPPTEQPANHQPAPEAQPSELAATSAAQPTQLDTAEQPTAQQPIVVPEAAGGATAQRPASLPRTGGQASPTWLALGMAGLLIGIGWFIRRREAHARDRTR